MKTSPSDAGSSCGTCERVVPLGALFCPSCGESAPTELMPDPAADAEELLRTDLQRALGLGFRVDNVLGAGAFGKVFRARDLKLKRDVAVKVLRRDGTDFLERFAREAQALAALEHPNIVKIHAMDGKEGLFYLVMEMVNGVSLTRYLQDKPKGLSVSEATRILIELLKAVATVHHHGLIHRDIKPDNVMLAGPERRTLLMDFGIAKEIESKDQGLTASGMAIGTPRYMSPEQATGDKTIDHRSDIYAVGLIGYELFTSKVPFDAESTMGLLAKKMMTPPPEARASRAEVPVAISSALVRAMARRPEDRFQSADEFIAALGPVPIASPPATGRKMVRYAAMAGIVGLLLAGAWATRTMLQPVPTVDLSISVTAQQARLNLGAQQPLWNRTLALQSIGMSGLSSATIPASGTTAEAALNSSELYLQSLAHDTVAGQIGMEPLVIPAGVLLVLTGSGTPDVVQLALSDTVPAFSLSVRGRVAVQGDSLTFASEQVRVRPSIGTLDLEMKLDAPLPDRVFDMLTVSGISFDVLERIRDEESTNDRLRSTVLGGTIEFRGANREAHQLAAEESLVLPQFRGQLREVRSDSIGLHLVLEGSVDSLPAALGTMPSAISAAWSLRRLTVISAVLAYLTAFVALLFLLRRKP